jgi:hypothetical protein
LEGLVVSIPLPIIANFGQHPGSEDQPCPRQALLTGSRGKEYLAVRMLFEKLLDLHLVAFDLTEEGLQLAHKGQHVTGFGPHQPGLYTHLGLLKYLEELLYPLRTSVAVFTQEAPQSFQREARSALRSRIGLQEG